MFLAEYDEVKALKMERQEGFLEGFLEGFQEGFLEGFRKGLQEGIMEERQRTVSAMIKEGGMSVSYIAKITEMSEDAVRKLAQTMGRAVL